MTARLHRHRKAGIDKKWRQDIHSLNYCTIVETLFFFWCRTQSQPAVTLSWHSDTCTAAHPTPLLIHLLLLGHRSGAVTLSGGAVWASSLAQHCPSEVDLQSCRRVRGMEVAVWVVEAGSWVADVCVVSSCFPMDRFINIPEQEFEGPLQTN